MRILIIGGGIAGSAAALALHKAGFAPVVYEAHPHSAEDLGAFLTLASNGMRALVQIDAAHVVAQIGFPLTRLRVIDASGAAIADAPLGDHQNPLTQYRCLRRADLAVALQREVARQGIAIRHGARLQAISEESDRITAQFTDGHSVTGDLLIGADGLNSTVRRLISKSESVTGDLLIGADKPVSTVARPMSDGHGVSDSPPIGPGGLDSTGRPLVGDGHSVSADQLTAADEAASTARPPTNDGHGVSGDLHVAADNAASTARPLTIDSEVKPRYAGQRVFYGYTAAAAPEASGSITMIRASGAAFGYACSPDGETFWFARVSGPPALADEIAQTAPEQWRDQLLSLLRHDTTPAADIVRATTDQLMLTNAWDLPLGITWRTQRAALIGDAAHAASPATGQGASMALEDAVVLAKALRDAPTISAALIAYETLRRSRVEHNIIVSAELSAGRRPSPQAGPQHADNNARVAPVSDDELARQLEWAIPLPALDPQP